MASKADIERAIAEARGVWNNPFNLGTRGFWAFFDAMFDRFVSAGPERVDELRRLADATGGPVLDGTPGSLGLLDDWLRVAVVAGADWDDGADWLPVWTRVTEPWPLPRGMRWPEFLRLEERVAFYFADVLMSQLPGAKWVCWRDERFNTNRTGDFLVDMGTFPHPADPLMSASRSIRSVWPTLPDPGDPEYEASKEYTLCSEFDMNVLWRLKWEAEGRPLDFQAAPTGDGAGVNRGPYKGSRIKAKFGERRGYG